MTVSVVVNTSCFRFVCLCRVRYKCASEVIIELKTFLVEVVGAKMSSGFRFYF
jgi:hypothetical protein